MAVCVLVGFEQCYFENERDLKSFAKFPSPLPVSTQLQSLSYTPVSAFAHAGLPFGGQDEASKPQGKNTVAYEARLLKALFLQLTTTYTDQIAKSNG